MENIDHVLIVDDDRGIRELLATYLEKNGMRVSLAANGRQMRAVLEQGAPDLIVLDLMLPGEDGLVLCRELRAGKFRTVPVLMLTARSEEADRIVGLEMGADDYLSKPFAVRELLARIRSVLRRARMLPPGMQVTETAPMIGFGDWRLDTTARHLLDAEGTMVALSGAEDIGIGVARAIRAAVSGRPGGVYLDLPAKLLAQTMDAVKAQQSLVKVVDAAPRQLPAPESVKRAIEVLKSAKRPLILLGKGAAYAQADAEIRAFVEQSGIPYLPMSMAKGLLPDTHEQSASAARSFVLQEADVVVLIGARLNWLLSHGKGKTWGAAPKRFVQVDISPTEIDSNVAIAAPVIGDIGSCVAALRAGLDASFAKPAAEWTGAIAERKSKNLAKMAATLDQNPSPMNFHSALRAIRDVLKTRPDINVVNEGANTLDYARSIIDMYEPRKRFDSGTWGIMGIGMGFAIGAAVTSGKPVVAIEGDSAFGFSGMELETICRYDLPVCTIVFNNNGVYRGTDVNPTGGKDVAPTVFVKGARYDRMIEAFGGIGYHATTPEELTNALLEAIASGKPSLINAVIDEAAGTESGRLTNLNPQSAAMKK